ncbi:transposase [Sesbania bispinosa]|nr:transposase [Sesbania bispinosa]
MTINLTPGLITTVTDRTTALRLFDKHPRPKRGLLEAGQWTKMEDSGGIAPGCLGLSLERPGRSGRAGR